MVLHDLRMSNQAFNLLAPESWKSARARNVSQTIALDWGGSQEVSRPLFGLGWVRRSKQGLTHLAPESSKSARARNVSQTTALDWGGSQEVKTILSSFGTGILEVCECQKRVANHCFGLGWVSGGQNNTKLVWHRNPGSLRVLRSCRRPLIWIGVSLRRSKQGLTRLAP